TRPPHESLFWRLGAQTAIRRGDWKLVRYDPALDTGARSSGPGTATPARLYNLAQDIGEKDDLSAKHPDKVAELQAPWDSRNSRTVEPFWGQGRAAPRSSQ